MIRSRLVILKIADRLRLVTKGNDVNSKVFLDLDVEGFREHLAWATELTHFSLVEQPSTNFRCGLFLRSGYTRTYEGSGTPIGATMPGAGGANESTRHAPFSTVTAFNLESRLQIGIWNDTGTANESGVYSGSVGLLLVGQ